MPMIVNDIGLTAAQYGQVVSAFGFAKLLGNVPTAVLVTTHGYVLYSSSYGYFVRVYYELTLAISP